MIFWHDASRLASFISTLPTKTHGLVMEARQNLASFHSPHTFSGIPFSQFRRAAVICSSNVEKEKCIERMIEKFLDSGYAEESLQKAKERAIMLDRDVILGEVDRVKDSDAEEGMMTIVINQDLGLRQLLAQLLKEHKEDYEELLGETKFVISERRFTNIAGLLFRRSDFLGLICGLMEIRNARQENASQKERCHWANW